MAATKKISVGAEKRQNWSVFSHLKKHIKTELRVLLDGRDCCHLAPDGIWQELHNNTARCKATSHRAVTRGSHCTVAPVANHVLVKEI